jgi:hypothetical protein|tara:strand:+ start:98 stop:334 length:237 start_codon:yes stop_codon:yes gene_type:complete
MWGYGIVKAQLKNGNKMFRIGTTFGEYGDRGVILQYCKVLPKHHKRENEVGPFYGVNYESNKYVWYNQKEMIELLNNL